MKKPLVGLLALYVELYDRTSPEIRPEIDAFHAHVCEKLRETGIEVVDAPACRLKDEFANAISYFEQCNVDAIVTLHLAYSPSLESEAALKSTKLPLIVLDTTRDYVFDGSTPVEAIMINHGIHGVQDMCNLLRRNKKDFVLCAGHLEHSEVLSEVKSAATAAMLKHSFCSSRVGMVGDSFAGMGDFVVSPAQLKEHFGIDVVKYDFDLGASLIKTVTEKEISTQLSDDSQRFSVDEKLTQECRERSARTEIGMRKWLESKQLSAFTINFLETDGSPDGLPTMPFLECSKAMARGIGYAGEGDTLTAAFVGSLLCAFEKTTFAEMFCPDWKNGCVFLSHMGEYNLNVSSDKPLLTEKPFPFTSAENPSVAYSTMMGGKALYTNLAPLGDGRYSLIIASGEMVCPTGENKLAMSVNGWFKPDCGLPRFLKEFSLAGGTHHGAVVYGGDVQTLKTFSGFMGFDLAVI